MHVRTFLFLTVSTLVLTMGHVGESDAAAVSLKLKDGRAIELYEHSYALVVGMKDYTNWPDLPGVGDDLKAVKAVLERHGFTVHTLLNPTRATFDDAIRQFIGRYGQNSNNRLLFYFASHGYTLTTQWGRDLGYIVPSDTPLPSTGVGAFKRKAISMLEMEIYAKQIEAKHALFMFDSCFSGSLFEINRAVPASISVKTAQPVRQFITAGTADQQVPDQSIFRRQFVAGLQGGADLNTDGFITGSELAQFLEDSVTNYSHRSQTPQYGKIRDPILDKGDFVFVAPHKPKVTVAKAAPRAQDDQLTVELTYWNSIKDSDDPALFEAYLEDYPGGRFAKLAKINIERLNASDKKPEEEEAKEEKPPMVIDTSVREKKQKISAAPEPPYRIAIFPAGGCFVDQWICLPLSDETVRHLQAIIHRDRALLLTYSYYDKALNVPRIKKPDRLWVGAAGRKEPNLELVYKIGRERDIDGVLMLWSTAFQGTDNRPTSVDLYLADIAGQQVYRRTGKDKESDMRKMTREVLAEFIKGRSAASRVEAGSSSQSTQ